MEKENKFYVYEWFIKDTGEVFYVGKGSGNRYKTIARRNKFFNDMFSTHECDVRIILDHLSEKAAFTLEKIMIDYYRNDTSYRLTNICDGGEGSSGYKMPEDVKEKISIKSKEHWDDKDFYEKMIKIRNKEGSVYKSQEFREKISKLVKGENNPNYGNRWNDEQKEHLSLIRKENKLAKGSNNSRATKIICLETGEVFDFIGLAMEKYDVKNEASFSVALKERKRTAAGLHWMLFDDKLTDRQFRFEELIRSLSLSEKPSLVCIETKEIFPNKKSFYNFVGKGQKFFDKNYDHYNGISINDKTYMLSIDYLGRFIQ